MRKGQFIIFIYILTVNLEIIINCRNSFVRYNIRNTFFSFWGDKPNFNKITDADNKDEGIFDVATIMHHIKTFNFISVMCWLTFLSPFLQLLNHGFKCRNSFFMNVRYMIQFLRIHHWTERNWCRLIVSIEIN